MDDKALQKRVIDQLEWSPSVDSAHIGVTARSGVVTLTGKVASYAAQLAAERITGQVEGVKAVAAELRVEFPSSLATEDDDIARRVAQLLSWNVEVPADKVKIKIQSGWVTLTGELEWNYQKTAAEKAIRTLPGVLGVTNAVTIKPRVASGDIREKIVAALERTARIEANNIAIATQGGKVTLTGNVPSWEDRFTAEDAAWSAPGVVEVEDKLTVL